MKTYRGERTPKGCRVTVDGKPLPLRLDLADHSPTGFEWGYGGSGPAQLALALLADACGDVTALVCYQNFKRDVVVPLEGCFWETSDEAIEDWVERERGRAMRESIRA